MKIILISLAMLTLQLRIQGQNMNAEFINLPNPNLDEVVISDSDTCLKICQYKHPALWLDGEKIYLSSLVTAKKKLEISDSIMLSKQLYNQLGNILDFLIYQGTFYFLGTKNLIIIEPTGKSKVIFNDKYQRLLMTKDGIYLARNFSMEKQKEMFQFCKLISKEKEYSLGKCLSLKQFSLENTFSIYSTINFTASNKKNTIFSANLSDNSIDVIKIGEDTVIKYPFISINIATPDSSVARRCVKLHKKYGINNSYDNLDALIATTDSLTIITSISAHGENALLLNLQNKKLKHNWFSQLLYVSLDSNNNIEVKDISWKLTDYANYSKNKVPYYTFGRRAYSAGEHWFAIPSTINEEELFDNFTLSDYQKVRDKNLKTKSIILVEIKTK